MAAPGRDKFPAYYAHMIDLHRATVRDGGGGARRRHARSTWAPTPAAASRTAWSPQEAADLVTAGAVAGRGARRRDAGRLATGSGRPGIEEGASADLVVYEADPRVDIRVLASPEAIVLRGQTV